GADVAPLVQFDPELIENAAVAPFGTDEAHGEQDEIGLQLELAAGDLLHAHAAVLALDPLKPDGVQLADPAFVVAAEGPGIDGPVAPAAFHMARGRAQDH